MKKIYIVLSLILILTFRYYYEHEDKMLDKALIYAKENRNELKKVLKYTKTRSHTDNFGENNVKCLIAKGICRFVPHSSAGGF